MSQSIEKGKDGLRAEIRAADLRATPGRIATLEFLRRAGSPLTHADVADALSPLGIDKATAFRNLNDLSEAGLLRRTELGDHVYRFEAVDQNLAKRDQHARAHPHFICVDCGEVTCLDDVRLTAGSRRESQAVGDVTEILLRGHCRECRD